MKLGSQLAPLEKRQWAVAVGVGVAVAVGGGIRAEAKAVRVVQEDSPVACRASGFAVFLEAILKNAAEGTM